jgi:hypothetical protein
MKGKTAKSQIFLIMCVCIFICLQTGCKSIRKNTSSLESLKLIDDFPLYTMYYEGEYTWSSGFETVGIADRPPVNLQQIPSPLNLSWGCSLFAAFGDSNNALYGRNFDWNFSPAVLLFVKPAQGYASVSMVDIAYLGYKGERSKNLLGLSKGEQQALLDAPALPFDGMNEKGVTIGMASVPAGNMPDDPKKPSIDSLLVIREMLDHASDVEEAVRILEKYDIEMGSVPLHYLIADRTGKAALVEYYQGKTFVQYNEKPWHMATNFIVASTRNSPQGRCRRYDKITSVMEDNLGKLTSDQAITLLKDVSSSDTEYGTQWSVVYDISNGGLWVVMGRNYEKVYSFQLQ